MRHVINTMLLIFGLALLVFAITPTVNRWLNQHCLLYRDLLCKLRRDTMHRYRTCPTAHPVKAGPVFAARSLLALFI
jgi:hypothetical protein